MATTTAPQKLTVDSILWAEEEEGHQTCEAHAGFYLADALRIRDALIERGLIRASHRNAPVDTPLGVWHLQTPQQIKTWQRATRDLPLWADYPCDTCREQVSKG